MDCYTALENIGLWYFFLGHLLVSSLDVVHALSEEDDTKDNECNYDGCLYTKLDSPRGTASLEKAVHTLLHSVYIVNVGSYLYGYMLTLKQLFNFKSQTYLSGHAANTNHLPLFHPCSG